MSGDEVVSHLPRIVFVAIFKWKFIFSNVFSEWVRLRARVWEFDLARERDGQLCAKFGEALFYSSNWSFGNGAEPERGWLEKEQKKEKNESFGWFFIKEGERSSS